MEGELKIDEEERESVKLLKKQERYFCDKINETIEKRSGVKNTHQVHGACPNCGCSYSECECEK